MINNKLSDILNRFFLSELKELSKKYKLIKEEDDNKVNVIINKVKTYEGYEILYNDLEQTLELAKGYENNNNLEEIQFYLWLNKYVEPIDLEEANDHYEQVTAGGFTLVDNYLIYREGANLNWIIKQLLKDILDDEYEVARLFDKDYIIELWIEDTSKEEVIDELINTVSYSDILNTEPEEAYETENGDRIMYFTLEF